VGHGPTRKGHGGSGRTERYIKQDTWIVNAINKEEATDIAMSVDPDTSEVVEVTSTTTEPLRDHIKKILEES
jgi:hypothetical protein